MASSCVQSGPACSGDEEQSLQESSLWSNQEQGDDKQDNHLRTICFKEQEKAMPEESFIFSSLVCGMLEFSNEEAGFQEKEKPDSEEVPALCYTECNETQIDLKEPSADSECNGQAHDDDQDAVYENIVSKREKLKETDEYKRAMKEEWAARQLQIQVQGKEAQRLRKRKMVETVRILDMEKRQKQRVEELRDTQKKDEECMNLKEQLRVETREELRNLEETCTDMASLLGGLGIIVGGGLEPTSNEVNAAYKRAALRFHPDRASRTNIQQQVEAEEKFKLISRMKLKLLS